VPSRTIGNKFVLPACHSRRFLELVRRAGTSWRCWQVNAPQSLACDKPDKRSWRVTRCLPAVAQDIGNEGAYVGENLRW